LNREEINLPKFSLDQFRSYQGKIHWKKQHWREGNTQEIRGTTTTKANPTQNDKNLKKGRELCCLA